MSLDPARAPFLNGPRHDVEGRFFANLPFTSRVHSLEVGG
jgi:hypothetical protein